MILPKPVTRKTLKGRKQRAERAVKQRIRALCVERDGNCRIESLKWGDVIEPSLIREHWCSMTMYSEWAHLPPRRRSQTRGMEPDYRHTTTHTIMLCQKHHAMEEAHALKVEYLSDSGCDGPLRFTVED